MTVADGRRRSLVLAFLPALILAGATRATGRDRDTAPLPPLTPALVADITRQVLATAGLGPEALAIDARDRSQYGGGPYRLELYDALAGAPERILPLARAMQEDVARAAAPFDLLLFAGRRAGYGVRRGLVEDPIAGLRADADSAGALERALAALGADAGAARDFAAAAPAALHRPLALLLGGIRLAADWRALAFAALSPAEDDTLLVRAQEYVGEDDENDSPGSQELAPGREVEVMLDRVDFAYLHAGAMDLLLAVSAALADLDTLLAAAPPDTASPSLTAATPWGPVVLGGRGDDEHSGPALLVLDLGGDDRYGAVAAAAGRARPVSLAIDLGGHDAHESTAAPAAGAGLLGYGFLIDRGEDADRYRGGRLSQGAGLFGVGGLWDDGGNDEYEAVAGAQGAGFFGLGILADAGGNDRYHAFQESQGFGFTRGAGLLVDRAGDDAYVADDTDIRYPAPQSKEHNANLCQGFGHGKRADYVDGHSLAGGFGLLADLAGDDEYRAGIFGQGAGYWYGIGLLLDGAGSDRYDGVWYVQGSGAHFALGLLADSSGDDAYRASLNMAQGAGHDFSLGVLYDEAGDDAYEGPSLSLGAGNANGIGWFWDRRGDDRYRVTAPGPAPGPGPAPVALGRASPTAREGLRQHMASLGLFMDTGGTDRYEAPPALRAGDGRTWVQPPAAGDEEARGVGFDGREPAPRKH